MEQLLMLQDEVEKIEDELGIETRWTRTSSSWVEAERIRRNRHFQQCIDELERLVVQRLLELSKAGLANTGDVIMLLSDVYNSHTFVGYKLRMHIMKSLAVRSAAIKTALARYNKAAAELNPPSRPITWESIANVRILADFDLLRGSRRQVLTQEWAKPENRQRVEQWHRAQRAQEEIPRLNVEVRRVRTLIADESRNLPIMAAKIADDDPLLGWAAQQYVTRRHKVNGLVSKKLEQLVQMPGYTGTHELGVRVGTNASICHSQYT